MRMDIFMQVRIRAFFKSLQELVTSVSLITNVS